MSTDPFIGEIKIFGFNFAPRNYQTCSGQILAISQNTALFSLLGTTYGGDGRTTFALPDLRGRVAKNQGQGPGLANYTMGQSAGSASVTLLTSNLPSHNHPANGITAHLPVANGVGNSNSPTGNYLAQAPVDMYSTAATVGETYGSALPATGATGIAGSSTPFNIENPYLVVNYCIALLGIFPSRN
ncbi:MULTISPECIES: phage tail protein [unclassified Flavobacterium]|uniref:phage tail protein n=1 Tax=unclassified Flavobacterium TaxID=196869 RepID=UPI001290B63C|nr:MULTISPECIES: tail fiber protein [unclassified Flavobacterium]MQP52200.1 phage tail protein [Flavobacterium sp. LMO9]MQP62070.1 phage tail protein [Flavobacterium sp. LMO6]